MHSSSYYSRKAANCRELGRWAAADEWAAMAAKARRIEQARKLRDGKTTIGKGTRLTKKKVRDVLASDVKAYFKMSHAERQERQQIAVESQRTYNR